MVKYILAYVISRDRNEHEQEMEIGAEHINETYG